MRHILGLGIALAALLASAPAQAQAPRGGVHTHDGFFLQMDLGLGGVRTSAEQGGMEVKASGGAGEFSVGVGGALTPSLIVAGQLWGVANPDPTVKVNGVEVDNGDTTVSLSGIGVQLVYYVMPLNLYLSVTPSLTQLTFDDGKTSEDSETGFGMKFAVGKEWWVSDNWAIGLNGQFAFSTNDSKYAGEPSWGTRWFGVAFSATYN